MPFGAGDNLDRRSLGIAARLCLGGTAADENVTVQGFDFDGLAIAQSRGASDIKRNPDREALSPFSNNDP